MYTLNGVRLGAGRGAPVINGGKQARINANYPYEYNKWGMVWNGNYFAPPELGAVLWYPGVPGAGSTIQDFAESYSDSGINTNEILDATETGVDCSADATTACPIDSIILVESEKMFVTATGTTLTVNRGYGGTVAVGHATAKDIYVWIPNHGTIYGATWVRLPSGLWSLSFDGTDDYVTIAAADNLSFTDGAGNDVAATMLSWCKITNYTNVNSIFTKRDSAILAEWALTISQTAGLLFCVCYKGTDANTSINQISNAAVGTETWILLGATYSGSELNTGIILYKNGVAVASTAGGAGTYTGMSNMAIPLRIGVMQTTLVNDFTGSMALHLIIRGTALTATQILNWYNQTRHLFGV